MAKRSGIGAGATLKLFRRMAKHPWIGLKLAKLQQEKWMFNLLRRDDGRARKIRQVSIRITDLCNLRCVMCGQWGESGFLHGKDLKELKRAEVPLERYIHIFDDLVANGHKPLVYLWGGEPTLYEGWLDLVAHVTRLGLPASIATNGTNLVPFAKRIAEIPLFLLQVSIDGHNAELHNRIRRGVGRTDSFASIQEGLAAVREARRAAGSELPLIASLTTVSRDNAAHLVDIYEAYQDKVDFSVFYPAWWIDEPSAKAHDADFERRFGFAPTLHWGWLGGWTPEDYQALDRQMQELKRRSAPWGKPPVILLPDISGVDNLRAYYTDHAETFGYNQCVSTSQVVEIDSNGDLSPCRDYHDYVVGNIKTATVSQLWNNERYRAFRKSLAKDGLMPVCSRCCGLMGY